MTPFIFAGHCVVVRLFTLESYMQRKFVYQLGITVVVLVVVSVSVLSLRIIAQARQDSRVPIQGQTAPLISRAQLLGAANAQQSLNLSIGLQPRNQQELDGLLRQIYDPRLCCI